MVGWDPLEVEAGIAGESMLGASRFPGVGEAALKSCNGCRPEVAALDNFEGFEGAETH